MHEANARNVAEASNKQFIDGLAVAKFEQPCSVPLDSVRNGAAARLRQAFKWRSRENVLTFQLQVNEEWGNVKITRGGGT